LKQFIEESGSSIRMQKPPAAAWTNVSLGKSNFSLSPNVFVRENKINIWVNIFGPNAKHNFDELKSKCFDRSVAEFGPEIEWDRKDTRKCLRLL